MEAITTTVFSGTNGSDTAAIDITLDAVKEFQVVASGANANRADCGASERESQIKDQ